MTRSSKAVLLSGSALLLFAFDNAALAQADNTGTNTPRSGATTLPDIEVTAPKQTTVVRKKPTLNAAARRAVSPTAAQSTSTSSATQPSAQAAQLAAKNGVFDQARGDTATT